MEVLEFKENNNSWIEKYKPKKISEIVGNIQAINSIVLWLNNFNTNKKEKLKQLDNNKKKIKSKPKKIKKEIIADTLELTENLDILELEPEILDLNLNININEDIIIKKDYKTKTDKTSCLIITGNHGIGKTCSVLAILNENNYTIQTLNLSKIKTNQNIKETLDSISLSTSNFNLMSHFNKNTNIKNILVIDEIEAISSITEKACIMELIKLNEEKWFFPIIFISNNQHNKFVGEIKKNAHEVKLWSPNDDDMAKLLKKICLKANMKIESEESINNIINLCQKDMRKLVMVLQELRSLYANANGNTNGNTNGNINKYKYNEDTKDKIILKTEKINDYILSTKKKDFDFDLFKASENLLLKYENIDNALRYYDIDKTTIPLMIQQNYIDCIDEYYINGNTQEETEKKKFEIANKVNSYICKGDIVENYIHSEMCWDINIAHALYSSIIPSYLLKTDLEITDSLLNAIKINLLYPVDLNRFSIKKINKININNVNNTFDNMNIEDYLYLNQIIKYQLEKNEYKECIENFKDYKNFDIDTLERLLKVDKIQFSKNNIKPKDKKELSKYLNSNNILNKQEKKNTKTHEKSKI